MKTKKKDKIIYTGDSKLVNSLENYDYNDYLNLESKKQKLPGFDKEYKDFVDYIIKITHRIWEEKGIGIIYDTYHNNVVMHFGATNDVGIDKIIKGTLETLHAFPDRKLIGQNVIWSPHGKNQFLSSHRIISTATNLNDSSFGPATGKKINFRTAVDCLAENNRIFEEWLVRDNLWIVKQLGFDPHVVAKNMAKSAIDKSDSINGLETNMHGQFMPEKYSASNTTIGEKIKEIFNNIYNCRMFNLVEKHYASNAVLHYICDEDLTSHEKIKGMLVNFFASFPNARYLIERITVNQRQEKDSYDVAIRWKVSGIHEGLGLFGKPLGNHVEILGITQLYIKEDKIVEEWMTYDALNVLKQIYLNNVDEDNQLATQSKCCEAKDMDCTCTESKENEEK